jgi:uncharacterized protein YciI
MKKIIILMLALNGSFAGMAQTKPVDSSHTTKRPENQIRKYFFVMLIKGPNRSKDSATAAKVQDGHMANMSRLYYDGKLKVAGPFGDDGNWRGIFIFDCTTQEETEALLKTDPAIIAGSLKYEIHPWYTAAIGSFIPGKPAKF